MGANDAPLRFFLAAVLENRKALRCSLSEYHPALVQKKMSLNLKMSLDGRCARRAIPWRGLRPRNVNQHGRGKRQNSQLRNMHTHSDTCRQMYGVADRARCRTLQVMMMMEKRDATRQQKNADEKPGGDSPERVGRQIGTKPEPQPYPGQFGPSLP
jgi:hypothetical protein